MALATTLAIASLPTFGWQRSGLTLKQAKGSLASTVPVVMLYALFFIALAHFFPSEAASGETVAFQLTMPGLEEEPFYRGVLLLALDQAFLRARQVPRRRLGLGCRPLVPPVRPRPCVRVLARQLLIRSDDDGAHGAAFVHRGVAAPSYRKRAPARSAPQLRQFDFAVCVTLVVEGQFAVAGDRRTRHLPSLCVPHYGRSFMCARATRRSGFDSAKIVYRGEIGEQIGARRLPTQPRPCPRVRRGHVERCEGCHPAEIALDLVVCDRADRHPVPFAIASAMARAVTPSSTDAL